MSPHSPTPNPNVDAILNRFELALSEERRALRALDHDAIEQLAGQKAELASALAQALTAGASAAERRKLEGIRSRIVQNQLLLIHARDSVRGVLAILTGAAGPTYGPAGARHLGRSAGLDTRG